MMSFQDGTDLEQTKVLDFLSLDKTQDIHEDTGPPTPRLEGISFNKAIIRPKRPFYGFSPISGLYNNRV